MKITPKMERVESELSANLSPCPECGNQPAIFRNTYPHGFTVKTAIACENCINEYFCGKLAPYPDSDKWQDSLYEAVSMWEMNAALLRDQPQPEGKDVPF